MTPPRGQSGQLDEISQAIGRLEGLVQGIERYVHEREHNIAGLSAKVDGIGAQIAREVGRLKGELQGEIKSFKDELEKLTVRVTKLESARIGDERVRSVWVEILKSPIVSGIIGGLCAAVLMAWAFVNGAGK